MLTFLIVCLGDLDVCGNDGVDSLHEDRHSFMVPAACVVADMLKLGQAAEAALRVLYIRGGVVGPNPTKRFTVHCLKRRGPLQC